MPMLRSRFFHTPLALLVAVTATASAADDPWYRYENQYFTAYSDASEHSVRGLLEDLEEFRAAFMQISNVVVPAGAPKTIVVMTKTPKEFDRLKIGKNVGGFASTQDGRTVIVMPASGGDNASTVIRHEYGHALLQYKKFPYPSWYEEGFAEIASAMKLKRGGASFTIGAPPERAQLNGRPVYPWEALFSEDFNPHALTDVRMGSSAYAQAWLMAQWATLGDSTRNSAMLQNYFDLIRSGEPALPAFEAAFGFPAADAWDVELSAYSRRIPAYTFTFRPGLLDREFSRRNADDEEVRPMLAYFERQSVALYRPSAPKDPRAAVDGVWGDLPLTGDACGRRVTVTVNGDTATLAVSIPDRPQDEDDAQDLASRRFRLKADADEPAAFHLEPIDDDATANDAANSIVALALRSADVACLSSGDKPHACRQVLARCAPGATAP